MPVIYYTYLDPFTEEKPGAYEKRQHETGRRLLFYGLSDLSELFTLPEESADKTSSLPDPYPLSQKVTSDFIFSLDSSFSLQKMETELSYTATGKPFFTNHSDVHFSISHCDGLALCAFHTSPVGVDAEKIGYFPEILPSRVFTVDEQQLLYTRGTTSLLRKEWFYRLWTLKEAFVKMTGAGLDSDLKAFSFSFQEEGQALIPLCSADQVECFQTLLPSRYIISLCCRRPAGQTKLIEIR